MEFHGEFFQELSSGFKTPFEIGASGEGLRPDDYHLAKIDAMEASVIRGKK